jgi:hypothetical protein
MPFHPLCTAFIIAGEMAAAWRSMPASIGAKMCRLKKRLSAEFAPSVRLSFSYASMYGIFSNVHKKSGRSTSQCSGRKPRLAKWSAYSAMVLHCCGTSL